MRIVLPEPLAQRARAIAAGEVTPVPLEPAATVVLVRPAGETVEVYLQHRHRALAFAGGVHAFPGGRVDPADAAALLDDLTGPSAADWAARFGAASADEAAAHVAAAIRELVEETGVRLDPRGLVGWSRWVTPRFERRRFDAWFFVAEAPSGQEPRVATSESHEGVWMRPDDALAALEAGTLAMLPPTWWTLREIADRGSMAGVLAHPPPMHRYTVGWTRIGDDVVMAMPGDPAYPGDDPREGS